jgi:hypothetical protein
MKKQSVARLTALVYLWALTPGELLADLYDLVVPSARATTALETNPGAFDSSKIKGEMSCDKICAVLTTDRGNITADATCDTCGASVVDVSKGASGADYYTGDGIWNDTDHKYCADHGEVTDFAFQVPGAPDAGPSNGPNGNPIHGGGGGKGPGGEKKQGACPVPLANGETEAQCKTVSENLMRCKFHNSEVLTKCLVYNSATDGITFNWIVLAFDIAAAALCLTACILSAVPGAQGAAQGFAIACGASGITAAVIELGAVTSINKSVGAAVASGIVSVGGTIAGITSLAFSNAGGASQIGATCVSAGFFIALMIIRAVTIANMNGAKDSACQDIKNQLSEAMIGGTPDPEAGTYTNNGLPGTSSGGGADGSGAGTNGNGTQNGSSPDGEIPIEIPPGSGVASATDGGVLQKSGLDKDAAKIAKNFDKAAFLADPKKSVASMFQSAATAAGMDATNAEAAGALAKHLEEDPQFKRDVMGAMAAQGGASAKGGTTGASALAQLPTFGAKTPAGPTDASFEKQKKSAMTEPTSDDIFHEDWNGTIFQLVTFRLGKSSDRVEQMEWQTPLNRALTGLPSAKAAKDQKSVGRGLGSPATLKRGGN